jgi:putative transcriptional regulator
VNNELLRNTRIAAGVTQETMASALGYKDKSSYCLLEKGTVKCTVDQAKAIKEALRLTVEQYTDIFLR